MRTHDHPRLAVLAGPEASLAPADIARSSENLVDFVFVLDSNDSSAKAQDLRLVAEALAPSITIDLRNFDACTAALRGMGATAVTTFTDQLCMVTARLDANLKGTSAPTIPWGRKDALRQMLRTAGLSQVASALVSDETSLQAFIRSVGLPIVVKPIDGAASRDTWLMKQDSDVREFLRGSGIRHGRKDLFAERFIVGKAPPASHLADYVSVEVFRFGESEHMSRSRRTYAFVTDRLPPAWPCRETGFSVPSSWPPEEQESLKTMAVKALDALGATTGVFHVEMKPAQPIPEIIEINGRLGGFLNHLVRHGTGVDLGRMALSCALDGDEVLDLRWKRCVIILLFQPPARAAGITASPSRRNIAQLPGVVSVDGICPPGMAIDWRNGTNFWAVQVSITADDHEVLRARLIDVATYLADEFTYVDNAGRTVTDRTWLEHLTDGTQ